MWVVTITYALQALQNMVRDAYTLLQIERKILSKKEMKTLEEDEVS